MQQDLECHKGAVLSCDVSSDGWLFATTSADRTAKVSEKGHKCIHQINVTGQDILYLKVSELHLPVSSSWSLTVQTPAPVTPLVCTNTDTHLQ